MPKSRKKPVPIKTLQLRWDNWSEMCDHADVGKLTDGKATGCYIGPDGHPLPDGRTSEKIGLLIPTLEGLLVARQGDFIIRGVEGKLSVRQE